MAKPDILQTARKEVLLFDGGIGTQLQALGLPIGASPEAWNADHPDRVARVHRAYREAGAQILTTNSFGGSPKKLHIGQVAGDPELINRRAAEIAAGVIGDQGWVAGSIGPSGAMLMMGEISAEELHNGFQIQARGLAAGGADLIMIETMSDLEEAQIAVAAARSVCSLPVFLSLTFSPGQRGYRTMMGVDIPTAAAAIAEAGVDVLGCNCGTGIEDAIHIVREMAAHWHGIILCEPNAGLPALIDGHTVYQETPEVMAARLPDLVAAGARLVGGCCGTTPAHIAAFRTILSSGA